MTSRHGRTNTRTSSPSFDKAHGGYLVEFCGYLWIRMDQNGSVRWPGQIRLKSEDICISFAWVWQVVWMVSSPTSWKQLCTTIDKLKMHGSSCWKWDGGTRTDGSTSKNALESWVPPTIGQSSLKVPGRSLRRETTWALFLPNRNYQCCVMQCCND